ncbi:MAG: right-handed parallel beta-helix repeat-containing protein [Acidimicrobiales bacterium]
MAEAGRRRLVVLLVVAVAVVASCGSDEPEITIPDLRSSSTRTATVPPETATTEGSPMVAPDTDPSTFFVSPTVGDDGADGQTAEQPWRTLQPALDRLQPGHTLFLMDGIYTGGTEPGVAHFVINNGGTADAWVRVTAAPGHRPEIVASDGNGISVRADYVEVGGLRVRGEGFDDDNHYGWGLLIRNSHHVRLVDNEVSDMAVGGISSVESSNLEILYNEVHGNAYWGPEQGSGISIWHSRDAGLGPSPDGYHDRIIGNTVYRNENKVFSEWRDEPIITDGNGIIIDQSKEFGYTGRTLVANNVVFDNGGRGILVLESSRVDIVFNTTYANGRTEGLDGGPVELAAGRSDDVRILNNLAWSRPGAPAVIVAEATGVELGGNVLVTDNDATVATELDVVTRVDPGLRSPGIDPATADFRPLATSLVIDAGLAVDPAIGIDADGRQRIVGPPDVGAYEFATR